MEEEEEILIESFKTLSEEAKDLYCIDSVERIEVPSPLEFYRNYVAQNKPVIIINAINHWPALSKWNTAYLKSMMGNEMVTVDVTPNGLGDSVLNDTFFVKPEERKMTFSQFLEHHERRREKEEEIYYVQHQNGNFQSEFQNLSKDIDSELSWASEAFGSSPDVVNFWMGEDRSISSLHKDHYENIYAVVTGQKHFTLLPPIDLRYLYEDQFIDSRFEQRENGSWLVKEEHPQNKVRWIPVDPDNADPIKYPLFKHANPIHCTVKAGEVLYLPSLYYHKVAQKGDKEGKTIAINYWYDMQFSYNWCYFKFMEKVIEESKRMKEIKESKK
eukprot:TRINITY_DN6878_c0_g1_i1.p1 TRINITY_DN6878_c0_g1~~TRINITY_DN6878_c0_g1_i1.p1  ORF type:complete len:329 (-),score=125.44 TRINITY_DN6878_c0_g1_i1:14-1000(-)